MSDPIAEDTTTPTSDPPANETAVERTHCMDVLITRFEHVPDTHGGGVTWCVGFVATCLANGRTRYVDISVDRTNGESDDDLVARAWLVVKDGIIAWCEDIESRSAVVGTSFKT